MHNPARSGSMLLLCLGILSLVAVIAFGFLRLVTRYKDTNGPSTRQLMAQQAALAGRSHALEAILRDYGERGTFVRIGNPANSTAGKVAYPTTWTQANGVRVSHLDGAWRGTFLPPTRPGMSNVNGGSYPIDELTSDTRLDAPFTRVWGTIAADSLGTFDVQPFETGFANTTGRARVFEVEHYQQDAAVRLAITAGAPAIDNGVSQRFSNLSSVLTTAAGVRGDAGYYDENWREVARGGMAAVDARRVARYRLRYEVMVEELDSHVPINATGRDRPWGNEIRETAPDAVAVASPYDPLDQAALTRRTVRYSPSIFNLGYASQPWNLGEGPMPLFFGAMIEHMFQGRGMATNVDRDAQGFPTTWPLMYRRGNLDGQEAAGNDPVPNPGGYNVYGRGNANKWGVQTQYLYTDGINSTQQYKYGGRLAKTVGVPWEIAGNVLWHALTGRQVSFTNLWSGLGMFTGVGLNPYRAWAMYFLTPFSRGLELRNPATARDPTLRWQADTDTPMHANLLTATPITIHAMTLAYMPPTAKALRIESVDYQGGPGACSLVYNNPDMPMQFNIPSRDLFVTDMWRQGGNSAFSFTAPSRTVVDGVVAPDWFHADWSARRGNQHYPGGALSADLPPVPDCASDNTGLLIRTDNIRWIPGPYGGASDAPAPEFGMRNQGIDTLAGRTFLVLPTNYTVSAPALPPGWGAPAAAVTSGGVPIQDRITQAEWESTTPTPGQTYRDANGNTITGGPGSKPNWSASIHYAGSQSGGALAGFGKTWWCDVMVAFHSAITVTRAQWTQRDTYSFDPYWNNPGNSVALNATGNQEFRKTWDPRRFTTLADYDRVFLSQLGIDITNPSAPLVAVGWNIGVQRKRRGTWGARTEPIICIEPGTWNSGHNLRTLAGNTTSDDVGTVGTPKWQRLQEAGSNWGLLYPATPPDPSIYTSDWNLDPAKVASFVSTFQATNGLVFAKSSDGTVFSSRLRTAAMEMVLNDWRYSFLGSSPAYANDFRPLDFNGDGLVNCSVYPINRTALAQEVAYHLDHFVDAGVNGAGRTIDPRLGDTPFCIAGNFFMGKSRFYRVLTRGEVWDNVLGRIAASANLDSALCVDSADRDRPDDLTTGHLLYQRWFFDPQRPAQIQGR